MITIAIAMAAAAAVDTCCADLEKPDERKSLAIYTITLLP